MVQKNPGFLKKPKHRAFWVLLVLGFTRLLGFLYLNEQLGSLLVDLTHQLSFHLDLPVV